MTAIEAADLLLGVVLPVGLVSATGIVMVVVWIRRTVRRGKGYVGDDPGEYFVESRDYDASGWGGGDGGDGGGD
ncbi:MAG TPA: hypothetical protein VM555_05920 [Tahibacter sp.]|nr:hypothetical protein [Tahibacter sp.]